MVGGLRAPRPIPRVPEDLSLASPTLRRGARNHRALSARPPRVVHIVPSKFDRERGIIGGAERYAFELARHMASEVPTTLVTFGDTPTTERIGMLEIRVVGPPRRIRGQPLNPFSWAVIPEIRKADVVHCHQQHVVISSFAAVASRVFGKRVFVTDLGGGGWDISSYLSTDRWYHGHLHISAFSRRVHGHDANPAARVILGGVDTERFSPAAVPSLPGRVLFVGRLLPHKGVDDLVDALPDGMELEIIGQPYDQRFVDDLHSLARGKTVNFRHDCDDAALVASYRRSAVVVLPSVYRTRYGATTSVPELLGQTLLEGMACGVPAICTDVGSMPEVVQAGATGFVVPPNNPRELRGRLEWIRDHPDEAIGMGRAAREVVLSDFTWPAVVARCLDAYSSPLP